MSLVIHQQPARVVMQKAVQAMTGKLLSAGQNDIQDLAKAILTLEHSQAGEVCQYLLSPLCTRLGVARNNAVQQLHVQRLLAGKLDKTIKRLEYCRVSASLLTKASRQTQEVLGSTTFHDYLKKHCQRIGPTTSITNSLENLNLNTAQSYFHKNMQMLHALHKAIQPHRKSLPDLPGLKEARQQTHLKGKALNALIKNTSWVADTNIALPKKYESLINHLFGNANTKVQARARRILTRARQHMPIGAGVVNHTAKQCLFGAPPAEPNVAPMTLD